MARVEKWRVQFEAVIDDLWAKPFSWGDHDCGPGLVGNVVKAITGDDPAKPYRGKYSDAKGALRIIKRKGFANLGDMVASILPEIHPSEAKIGDIAAVKTDSAIGYALGVVNGERVFVLMENGIGTVDLLQCERAFKVG